MMDPLRPAPAVVASNEAPRFVALGLSFRTASVDVRERCAIPAEELPDRLQHLVARGLAHEVVLVSTCNRVECYALVPAATDVGALRESMGLPAEHVQVREGDAAIGHLFRVAASLDSLVLGEAQILGQVKEAVSVARAAGTFGSGLDPIFSRAFRLAKRVRTDTAIARSVVSVGHVAVELARTIFGALDGTSVLLVGAGKMGVLAARHLKAHGASKVLVANRTFERGRALAEQHGFSASAYDDLPLLLQAVDVVICSTGAPRPILTRPMIQAVMKKRRYRPLFLIDIAVPRDVEAGVGEVDDVYLYNIDDLEEVSRANAGGRAEAAREAETLVQSETEAFVRWRRERLHAPVIRALRESALETAAAEAEKALKMLPGLDDRGQDTIRKLAEVIANRLTRAPIEVLKERAGTRAGDQLAAAALELFDLDEPD